MFTAKNHCGVRLSVSVPDSRDACPNLDLAVALALCRVTLSGAINIVAVGNVAVKKCC